jgi:hypothetical protein
MWITIQAKHPSLSPRMRHKIDDFLRRTFHREERYIASCVVVLAPSKLGGQAGLTRRFRLWSAFLGSIDVVDFGDTIRTAVQQAALRSRKRVRRRLHKQRAKSRHLGRRQLSRWPAGLLDERARTTSENTRSEPLR